MSRSDGVAPIPKRKQPTYPYRGSSRRARSFQRSKRS